MRENSFLMNMYTTNFDIMKTLLWARLPKICLVPVQTTIGNLHRTFISRSITTGLTDITWMVYVTIVFQITMMDLLEKDIQIWFTIRTKKSRKRMEMITGIVSFITINFI